VNRYDVANAYYGRHIDNAVLGGRKQGNAMRSDLSCTVFLSAPEDYDGGELLIDDGCTARSFKLPAGDALLYSADRLHEVRPVTAGLRLASFFWVESLVRDAMARRLLFELDMNLLKLRARHGESAETLALTG